MNELRRTPRSAVKSVKRATRALLSQPRVSRALTTVARPFTERLPTPVLHRIPVVREFEVPVPGIAGSFRIYTHDDDMSKYVFWHGLEAWEPATVRLLVEVAGRSATFLDVGANVGIASLVFATANPAAAVHAFEPVPQVFRRLQRNAQLNPELANLSLHQLGLSKAPGEAIIHVPHEGWVRVPTDSSLHANFRENTEAVAVVLDTLDDFVRSKDIDRVDLIKVDTEGTEEWVLEGALKTLARDRPLVVCEILNSDRWLEPDERHEAHLAPLFAELDYAAFHLREDGPEPCTELRPDPRYRDLNFLFVPAEGRAGLPASSRLRPT